MTPFEEDKASKLQRILPLRIINALGMIAWQEDSYGCVKQSLRMLHPLSWIWMVAQITIAAVLYGLIEVAKDIKSRRDEMVWW